MLLYFENLNHNQSKVIFIIFIVSDMVTNTYLTKKNPWKVSSIQAFTFLKCPECNFDTKEEDNFQCHAIENHPLSFVFFGKTCEGEEFDENWTVTDDLPNESENWENGSTPQRRTRFPKTNLKRK